MGDTPRGGGSDMQVALISGDDSMKRLCREALATLPARPWNLSAVTPGEPVPAADLYIWDWEPRTTLPRLSGEMASGAHLLAINREEARNVLDALPFHFVTLVLKPINPDALRTCLEQAGNHYDSPAGGDAGGWDRCIKTATQFSTACSTTTLRLQEYDQDRMNFLARAVHDFRTPLTAVNGYCGMMLSGQLGPLTLAQQEVLGRTLHSIRRLGRLATALFQWSSGVRVGLRPQIQEADIEECCRQAFHEIRPLANEKSIAVEMDLQAPEQPLRFDPAQVEQLLVNLLENSCKFTPRGGYIKVRGASDFWERRAAAVPQNGISIERRRASSRRANAYRIEVSDNGMGVRPEHLQTIFQEYTSYGGGSDRSGSGLGLAICKRILAEHGGQIFAESGSKGVTFICMLPFSEPAPGGPSDAESSGIHLVAGNGGNGQGVRHDKTILIVEDEADARNYFEMVVRCLGYSIEIAENGEEALACLEGNRGISLVLLDLRMPRRDGLETLREMRSTGRHQPVIMLSGAATTTNVVQAIKSGATDFLAKPISHEDLRAAIQRVLQRWAAGGGRCRARAGGAASPKAGWGTTCRRLCGGWRLRMCPC